MVQWLVASAHELGNPDSNLGQGIQIFFLIEVLLSLRVTILSILSPQEEHIVNIVTPRGIYDKILFDLHTNERLSNVWRSYLLAVARRQRQRPCLLLI